jgi:hypothetical protein
MPLSPYLNLGGGISSPLTTKGDLFTYDTDDARLPIGTDGQALIADSAEATGLKWGTISADNMATADLTLTGNRTHDLDGNRLSFFGDDNIIFQGTSGGYGESRMYTYSPTNPFFKWQTSAGIYIGMRGNGNGNGCTVAINKEGTTFGTTTRFGVNVGSTANATGHFVGEGSTSATTTLLVENSSGTDLLKLNDAGNLGVGTAPSLSSRAYISTSTEEVSLRVENIATGTTPVSGLFITGGTVTGGSNRGVDASAYGNDTLNIGVRGNAGNPATGINVGGYFRAAQGASNHALRLDDGTQGANKVLKSDANGYTRWEEESESLVIACSDETTDLTTGNAKITFRMPYTMNLDSVRASVTTAPTGSNIEVDINESGISILSTKISIDAGEKTSVTAATPPVISDSVLADNTEITIDIDQIGSTISGTGLKIYLIGKKG